MFVLLIKILVGFIGLIWSADRFVLGASGLADRLKVSPLVIGLTIVAFGTSAPEIFVSIVAGIQNKSDIAVGNAIGSNIANIGLVLGISAMIRAIPCTEKTLKAEIPILILITFLVSFLIWFLDISIVLGLICVGLLAAYIFWLLHKTHRRNRENRELDQAFAEELPHKLKYSNIIISLLIGIILLPLSADLLVTNASMLAKMAGISDAIIGLTLIAIGTSLPELATSLAGILRNEHHIAFGNIIGSNIFNLTAVIAPVAMISEQKIADPFIFSRDMPFMIFITLLICSRIWFNGARTVISRAFGALTFSLYCGYIGLIIMQTII